MQAAARAYIIEAAEDCNCAQVLLAKGVLSRAAFSAQQSVEKGLKALAHYSSGNVLYAVSARIE